MENQNRFPALRQQMVEQQLQGRDITDPGVLAAMRKIERHLFVPRELSAGAYYDGPLPIGKNQTISQPYIVALMTQLLEIIPSDSVLEIGTGSGYQAAVLAEMARTVYSIEIVPELCDRSRKLLLEDLAYPNIHLRCGDGYDGWPQAAPFSKIMLTAAPPTVPQPLLQQLAPGGRLVVPVGESLQQLMVYTRDQKGRVQVEKNIPVRFVPMTGKAQGK